MAYGQYKKYYQEILDSIKSEGLYKEERIICSPQDGQIKVKFPASSPEKEIINLCARCV